MLKKLQQRFILINMLLVGIVLIIVCVAVVAMTYNSQKQEIERSLEIATNKMENEMSGGFGRWFFGGGGGMKNDDQEEVAIPTYTVKVDSSGNYIGVSQGNYLYNIDDEARDKAIKLSYTASANEGNLDSLGMYYKKTYLADGNSIIAFASSSQLKSRVMSTAMHAGMILVCSLIVMFIISYILSRITIKPVRKAWEQQQQFVADASHELKTPLAVILANNNILMSHQDETIDSQSKWVESTQAEATHMKNLVDNLLYLARSDASKDATKTIFSEVPLGEIAMDCALQFEPAAFEKGIEIDTSDIDAEIKIQGDTTKLRQLVHILIDNACKYGVSGGTVKVGLKKESNSNILYVHNGGKPIPAEDLPHIFERFYRSDKVRTHTDEQQSYGLGLAIAKSIVEEHNAKISVKSTAESGTTFSVEFKKS